MHGDNGSTLKATTVLATLYWLGVKPSYSRPRVSDDNAYAEPLFRTAKYCPEFPDKGFADLRTARTWAAEFVRWYNPWSTDTAASATSPPRSATAGRMWSSKPRATSCTARPANVTRRAGQVPRGTGRRCGR